MPIDLSKLLSKYKSGWVSVSKDNKKVLASAPNVEDLIEKLQKIGNPDGYILKAARDFGSYVG